MRIWQTGEQRSARAAAGLVILGLLLLNGAATAQPGNTLDHLTAGYVYFVPAVVWTTNGCAVFVVNVEAALTNARAFSFQFYVESASLEILELLPGSALGLHLMPELLRGDTLWLDGFFDSQTTGPSVNLAALRRSVVPQPDQRLPHPWPADQENASHEIFRLDLSYSCRTEGQSQA
jgi:hypothetical protein